LDNFAIKQCIHLLKNISQLDRTVVCTIHQPPSSLFQFFDQVMMGFFRKVFVASVGCADGHESGNAASEFLRFSDYELTVLYPIDPDATCLLDCLFQSSEDKYLRDQQPR
jgi:hypothetical protein